MGFDILATGRALPKKRVSNFDLEKIVETSDEWIEQRTGIQFRYYREDESTVSLGAEAARKTIEKAGIDKSEIGAILVPTFTPDYLTPSTACLIQRELGLEESIFALDVNAACSGFIYALRLAEGLFATMDEEKYILVVGSEVISRVLDFTDRGTCILFGDGAGGVLLQKNEKKKSIFSVGAKGGAEELGCKFSVKDEGNPYLYMDGKAVFRFATSTIPSCVNDVLEKSGVDREEIDFVVCHQANRRIIESAAKKLRMPLEKFYVNISEYGNTSSASIPIALDEMAEKGMLERGMKIVMVGFGGGLTWGGVLVTW